MIRVLAIALAALTLSASTLSLSAPNPRALTPGITLIGKGVVSGSALDTSGLTGNICQAGAPGKLRSESNLRWLWIGHNLHYSEMTRFTSELGVLTWRPSVPKRGSVGSQIVSNRREYSRG